MTHQHHSIGGILGRWTSVVLITIFLSLGSQSVQLNAQPTPVDLTELGLEEILSMTIIRGDSTEDGAQLQVVGKLED
ncbi:MAG: hypothetical protein HOI66_20370 [Verrucomicrobia bacterium]|nr:hypothetical protein [Verrucomicrobiota bacterium]